MRDLITDSSQVTIIKNKPPTVSENGVHGLNFYSRVTQPSIKNFQLVDSVGKFVSSLYSSLPDRRNGSPSVWTCWRRLFCA